ncbi:hypothetical protein [Shewanella sp. GXUN23E]|uniref:hypothetical protein n=1 Tax=Shewanella sp. GXUN23E TaxID=3422498 RepID=UPI003D7E1E6D
MNKLCLTAALALSLILSGNILAESIDYGDKQNEIRQLFTAYMDKYNGYLNQGELTVPSDIYLDEFMLMSNSQPARTSTPAEFVQQAKGFLGNLKQQGVASVGWESVDISILGDNLALASNVALRIKSDGSLFNRIGATYLLKRTDKGWRIAAFAVHRADQSMTRHH